MPGCILNKDSRRHPKGLLFPPWMPFSSSTARNPCRAFRGNYRIQHGQGLRCFSHIGHRIIQELDKMEMQNHLDRIISWLLRTICPSNAHPLLNASARVDAYHRLSLV